VSYATIDSGNPGKNIVVLGGVHGDEMHGTAVVEGLLKVFEKEPLHA
jgi:predicted deacylase